MTPLKAIWFRRVTGRGYGAVPIKLIYDPAWALLVACRCFVYQAIRGCTKRGEGMAA